MFWAVYPRKIGKLAALKAFAKARKTATLDDIIAGVDRYVMYKPDYADWAHPTTWLNAGRWMDDYTPRPSNQAWEPFQCPHEPECHGRHACGIRTMLDAGRLGAPR